MNKAKLGKISLNSRVVISEAIVSTSSGVLLLRRSKNNNLYIGKWQLPGGKVERGESPLQAVKREVLEETGCKCSKMSLVKRLSFSGSYKGSVSEIKLFVYTCKIIGKVCLSRDHSKLKFVKKSSIAPSSLAPVSRWALFDE